VKKVMSLILALAVLAVFYLGCGGVDRQAKVKCPKCGAVFTIDEALKNIGGGQ
jgi:hypothetical protein